MPAEPTVDTAAHQGARGDVDASRSPSPETGSGATAHDWQRDRWAWRAKVRANPIALFWYRIGVGLLGALMMIGAVLTGWLPGPGGIPLFMLGLLVWSSEFTWAHNIMLWFRRMFDRFLALPDRWRHTFYVVCGICVLATWYGLAVWHGVPGWMPDEVAAVLDRLPGIDR